MLFSRLAAALGIAFAPRSQDLGTVLSKNKDLSQYYALIQKYPDILLQLPNYNGVTIVAPSNAAFKNIPYTALNNIWDPTDKAATIPLLQYHILTGTVSTAALTQGVTYVEPTLLVDPKYTNVTTGQNVEVNKQDPDTVVFTTSVGTRCTVTQADIPFQGGLVQVVDNLLIPPAQLGPTAKAFQVSSFLGGLYAADLMPGTAYDNNITVFAPQDIAFDAVGGTLEKLDAKALARVMGYHIAPAQVLVSSALTNGTHLQTLANDASGNVLASVVIRQAGNNKYVNSAQIVQPDILLANGIMHIISDVLNPDDALAMPDPDIGTQAPVFAASTAKSPFTSDLPCTANCPVTSTTGTADAATRTTTSALFTSESDGAAAPARCTAQVAGAALGVMGLGAGMAWL